MTLNHDVITLLSFVLYQSLIPFCLAIILCVATVGGVYTLVRVDYRLALLGIFVKSPILASLNQLSRKDIVKYGRLYDVSRYRAFFLCIVSWYIKHSSLPL